MNHRTRLCRFPVAALAITVLLSASAASLAAEPVQVLAAGSLRQAMEELGRAYTATHYAAANSNANAAMVVFQFGPSGLLKARIEGSAVTEASAGAGDVFASANMEHPQALHAAGKSRAPRAFARNRMCLLTQAAVGPIAPNDPGAVLDAILNPALRLATSTPRADPAGDYAWRVFARAEGLRPGSQLRLQAKALQLAGGPNSARAPAGKTSYSWLMEDRQADLFLTYCTNAAEALSLVPGLRLVELPTALQVEAVYGIAVLKPGGQAFADFVLGHAGQAILQRFGFARP